jgi:hypothetical protein
MDIAVCSSATVRLGAHLETYAEYSAETNLHDDRRKFRKGLVTYLTHPRVMRSIFVGAREGGSARVLGN